MSSTFAKPVNNLKTTLASAHAVSDGQLVLAAGTGARLGSLPAGRIFRVTALLNADTVGEIVLGIFEATGLSTDTLTGVTAAEGFSDASLSAGTVIELRITAKSLSELQTSINTLETTVAFVSGTPTTGALAKWASASSLTTATAGTDYLTPTGNGSGLTNLTPANLSAGTAGINISGNAATATTAGTATIAGTISGSIAESQVVNLTTDLAAMAPLASPTFTGTPAAPTATVGTSTTQLATTAFVSAAVSAGVAIGAAVGGSPASGEILFTDSSGKLAQDANMLTWSASNKRLGLGGAPFNALFDVTHNSTYSTKAVQITNSSTNYSDIWINSGTSTMRFGMQQGLGYFLATSNDPMYIGTNSRQHIYITAAGLVWIGDDATGTAESPGAQLGVNPLSTSTIGIVVQALASPTAPLVQLWGVSSTSTKRAQATIDSAWVTSTDASRTGRLLLKAEDFTGTSREGMRVESTGSAPAVGFLGTAAAAQQTGGAATAGSSYTATEQGMLQKAYNALRTFGFLS